MPERRRLRLSGALLCRRSRLPAPPQLAADTVCLLGWGEATIVVAFRGTASMANALADIKVRGRCRGCCLGAEALALVQRLLPGCRAWRPQQAAPCGLSVLGLQTRLHPTLAIGAALSLEQLPPTLACPLPRPRP